ncbi:catalase family peroxidase [Komagataeibacter diospyri]|uniref:catalase family peroxidase n=1 Tax=Komagataeibacter diospyri TaxID=1932662 RepID=UPI0037583085
MKPVTLPAAGMRWLGVVAAPVTLALAFLWAGGWLTPHRLTQTSLLNALREVDGVHPGFRRNHAKGICVAGWFEGNGNATPLSAASVLNRDRVPVIGRFALAGGMPFQSDAPAKVRSMALRFMLPNGQEWRMGLNDIPVFPVRSAQEFRDLQLASRPDPVTGKPDPLRMKAFGASRLQAQRAIEQVRRRPLTSGFADDSYRSLDSFLFVAENGTKTAVRWTMVPVQPVASADSHPDAPDYLFRQLIDDIHVHPLQWRLMVTVAGSQDAIDDPSQNWAEGDRQIDAGTLTLMTIESEEGGSCTGITFDPLVLPVGVAPSGDPILQARSAAYMRSFALRSGEKPGVPAITPAMTALPTGVEEKKS